MNTIANLLQTPDLTMFSDLYPRRSMFWTVSGQRPSLPLPPPPPTPPFSQNGTSQLVERRLLLSKEWRVGAAFHYLIMRPPDIRTQQDTDLPGGGRGKVVLWGCGGESDDKRQQGGLL